MHIQLNNGVEIPQIGFGVFQLPPEETQKAVETALEAGYRHIDTAAAYKNEAGVGAAIRATGIDRSELFITTKLRNGEQGTGTSRQAFEESLANLGLDYVDLYLIHWPVPAHDQYVNSWRELEKIYGEKRARAIGVSNFLEPHLERLLAETDIVPVVNQIEIHPSFQQKPLTDFVRSKGIAVEAYSPLGQGCDLADPVIVALAEKHGVTAAQVILRWHLQAGTIVIPKSATPERIASNRDLAGFELSADEIASIDALERGARIGGDPAVFTFSQIR